MLNIYFEGPWYMDFAASAAKWPLARISSGDRDDAGAWNL
jgi:hypothetical protein